MKTTTAATTTAAPTERIVDGYSFLNDTDGDNRFNPGDTSRVKIVLSNDWGGDAVNVSLTLESSDPRITILDNYISFNDSPLGDVTIPPGEISSTVFDWFLVAADIEAVPGNIPCTVTITAGTEEYPYQETLDFSLDLTLSQFGFPVENINIKSLSDPIIKEKNYKNFNNSFINPKNM